MGRQKRYPSPSRIGGVARSEDCNIIALVAKQVVDGTNNQAEHLAVIEATLLGLKLGARKIHLEGD